MTMTLRRILLVSLAVTACVFCVVSADDDDESTSFCTGYQQEVKTKPNNKRSVFERRNPQYEITTLNNIRRDPNTVYWCDLKIPDLNDVIKHWKHYGFNATHWWVEKGCSGTFSIEECDTSYVRDHGPAPTSGKAPVQDLPAPAKPVKNWMKIMADKNFDMGTWGRESFNML